MTTALVGGSIFGQDGAVSRADVLMSGDKILEVGPNLKLAEGATTVRVQNKTILPGLIDAHTHLTHGYEGSVSDSEAAQGVRASHQALRALRSGVTTARELGSYRRIDIALRNAANAGVATAPRLICAGMYITITGGHGHPKGRAADGPDEVRKAVREQILAGADVIKIMCSGGAARVDESADWIQFSSAEIHAAVEEAHFAGRRVAAHAHPTTSIKWALEAGADSIEHGTYLDDECIDVMLDRNVFLVPTLAVYARMAEGEQPAALKARAAELYQAKVRTLRRALDRGVRVAVGTDSSAFFPVESYAAELELLVRETDLSARDVLLLATTGNADLLGLKDVGMIVPGAVADLTVVDGDPVEDLDRIRHVALTVRSGVIFDWTNLATSSGMGQSDEGQHS